VRWGRWEERGRRRTSGRKEEGNRVHYVSYYTEEYSFLFLATLDSVYVVGSLDEALSIRGFRYHPADIEATVVRCHKTVVGSAVFTSNKLLVVVSEMHGDEREALDIVPVITTALLEEHQLVTGIIVVVDPGTVPINSRGEKQRVHLRDSFLADEVDPIYVAYNL